jgi:tripartite-type tricarboxylate transporter receptor subunit TctC
MLNRDPDMEGDRIMPSFETASRRALVAVAACLIGTGATHAQGTPSYPSGRVTMIVGFAAGGFADTLGRFVAQRLSERYGHPVVVENRGGAGGNLAASAVAKAEPDGHTLLVITTALAINATMYERLDYAIDQLAAIAMPGSSAETFVAPPDRPATMKEFIAWAKNREITFATAGVGTGSHVAAEYFYREIAKIKAVHVPFRGGALAVQATLGGQVDAMTASLGTHTYINAGKLHGLAVASAKRNPVLPTVPTFAEAGFPNFEAASWVGFFAPARTNPAILTKLNRDINEIISDKASEEHLTKLGFTLAVRSVEESQQYLRAEVAKWGEWVRRIGVSVK